MSLFGRTLITAALLLGLASHAHAGTIEVGYASWYGPGFHGRRAANGEIFDQSKLTAAHPALPMGTRIKVTNVENGREVTLRVNDRGPYVKGRIVDVSRAAARLLGFARKGLALVRIEIAGSAPTESVSTSP